MSLTTGIKTEAVRDPNVISGSISDITVIAAALKAGNQPTLEEQLAISKTRIDLLKNLLEGFDSVLVQFMKMHEEQTALESREEALAEQRAKLGIFAGKEKKRIGEELATLSTKKNDLISQIGLLKQKLYGYTAKADVERDISSVQAEAAYLESLIKAGRTNNTCPYSYDQALKAYLSDPHINKVVNSILDPSAAPGSIIFGRYVQKENGGAAPIEWQVLVKENDRMLLISKYAIDCKSFCPVPAAITWETSYIRKWLNDTFLNSAFSNDEQKEIQSTIVAADKNPTFKTPPGNETTDKVFLLSIKEAKQYFSSDDLRKCEGTEYCYAQKKRSHFDKMTNAPGFWWWLRSPGYESRCAATVHSSGSVAVVGEAIVCNNIAVRPALWLELGS